MDRFDRIILKDISKLQKDICCLREAIDNGGGSGITIVTSCADLPDATLHTDEFYYVAVTDLDCPAGLYYSDGAEWTTNITDILTRLSTLEQNVYKVTYYEVVTGTSGTITLPTGATINADEFGNSGDSILSKINISNKPTFESPETIAGVVVTANLNPLDGTWTTSGTYTDSSVALIYSINISAEDYYNLNNFYIIESEELDNTSWGLTGNSDTTPGVNFLGTIDNKGLVFKTNNIQSGYIDLVTSSTSFGQSSLLNNTGVGNSAFGIEALKANISGVYNSGFGYLAGYKITGSRNSVFGALAGGDITSGVYNTMIGYGAGASVTTGSYNTIIGANITGTNSLTSAVLVGDGNGNIRFKSLTNGDFIIPYDSSNYFTTTVDFTGLTTFGATGSGAGFKFNNSVVLDYTTATTVPYLNASKTLVSSSVTPTELGYLSGVTSAIQTQIGTLLPKAGASYTTTTGTGLALSSSTLSSGTLASITVTGTAGLTNQKAFAIDVSGANGTGAQTTYGLYATNTHTGTSTNVAGYFSASGGSNNYGLLVAAGRVGIANTAPATDLDVTGAARFTTNLTIGITGTPPTSYQTTNGNASAARLVIVSSNVADSYSFAFDNVNKLGFNLTVANASGNHVTRGAINIASTVNTAGSERGDLTFSTQNAGAGLSEGLRQTYNQLIGIGTGATVSAKLHVISTTEQLRAGYDASNYVSNTVSSSGGLTTTLTGTARAISILASTVSLLKLDDNALYSVALGSSALANHTSGSGNIAVGYQTMLTSSSGGATANVGIGTQSLYTLSSSSYNVAIGYHAGYTLNGASNTLIGSGAGEYATGTLLTAVGNNSGNNSTGYQNSFWGSDLTGAVSGNYNVIIGSNISTAIANSNNIWIGDGQGNVRLKFISTGKATLGAYGSGTFTGTPTYTLQVDSSGNIIEGSANVSLTSTYIGYGNGSNILTGTSDFTYDGSQLTLRGKRAYYMGNGNGIIIVGGKNTGSHPAYGNYTVAVGWDAAQSTTSINSVSVGAFANNNQTSGTSVAIGYRANYGATSTTYNVAIGEDALYTEYSGSNVAIGYSAMKSGGFQGVAIGKDAGFAGVINQLSTAIGHSAFYNGTGFGGTAIGAGAGSGGTNRSDYGVFIGYNAGYNVSTGHGNVMIGGNTGGGVTTGGYNTIIGHNLTGLTSTLTANLILGAGTTNKVRWKSTTDGEFLNLFDSSNYLSISTNYAGATTIDAVGSSAGIYFVDNVTISGDIKLNVAGNGVYIKEGSNATMGVATLVAGTVTVSTTKVTANSRIFLSVQTLGTITTPVAVVVTAQTASTSFVITSADNTDTSTVAWVIIEPS